MQRLAEQVRRRPRLHHLSEVHHRHRIAHVPDHPQVVGDEQIRHPVLLLDVLEEVQDLRLHGDVEGGDRLVGHHQFRGEGDRAGDPDPLTLPAGELVGIFPARLRRHPDPDEQPFGPLPQLLPLREPVDEPPLPDDVAHLHPRVEGGVRVLEDDLHLAPRHPQRLAFQARDVVPVEPDRSGIGVQQADHEAGEGRLPAPRLPHQPERLSGRDREGDAVHGTHAEILPGEERLPHRERLVDVDHREERAVRFRPVDPAGHGAPPPRTARWWWHAAKCPGAYSYCGGSSRSHTARGSPGISPERNRERAS